MKIRLIWSIHFLQTESESGAESVLFHMMFFFSDARITVENGFHMFSRRRILMIALLSGRFPEIQ